MKKTKCLIFFVLCTVCALGFSQKRLTISGKEIYYQDSAVFLRGANIIAEIDKVSESDAENFKLMGMNFVRLIIDIDTEADWADTEGDGNYIKESALNNWETIVDWYASRQIWIMLEMRSNDYDLADSDFWLPGSALHTKWRKIWIALAARVKTKDYIAAWALLAEHGQSNRLKVKDSFRPIMQSLDSISGGNTPFSFGPKLNSIEFYDTANYTDWYWPEYANRIIYQINHLHPKPYINNDPAKGYDPTTWWYHRTDGQDGEGADNDDSMHKAGTLAHMSPGLAWRNFYNAPIYFDQWGCAFNQPGYMDYERDMLEIFEDNGQIPNTRWTYLMANERGIMTEYYGTWQLHPPLTDFFKLSYLQGSRWPHELSVSNYNAADNNITTDASSGTLPWNIDFKFAAPFACNKIELWNTNADSSQDPKNIAVFASTDSLNWVPLFTVSDIVFSARRSQFFSQSFANTTAYQYYRAQILANNGGAQTSISNLEFFPAAVSNQTSLIINVPQEDVFQIYQQTDFLKLDFPYTKEKFSVKLINQLGQLVLNQCDEHCSSLNVNISTLPLGVYIVCVQTPTRIFHRKIYVSK